MKKMQFLVERVRECLLREGRVYTVRSYDMWNEYVWVDGVGRCFRRQVAVITCQEDLARFVRWSGFASVAEWWQAIQRFCAGKPMWCYYVFIRNKVGE